jgi:regulator of replication initiation timing
MAHFSVDQQLQVQNAELRDEVARLTAEIHRLRAENRELRAALGLQSQCPGRARAWGSIETTAGTSIGPRRRRVGSA